MRIPKIQTVCGFGCGSSLMLRTSIERIARERNLVVKVFCGDVASCCANECDAIFISRELGARLRGRARVPVIEVDNFMDKTEVEQKTMGFLSSLR